MLHLYVPGWDVSKHLIITDEWRVSSHFIEHNEIRVYADDKKAERPGYSTSQNNVFSDRDAFTTSDLTQFDSRVGVGDKYDKETFTIEPSDTIIESLSKKQSKTSSLGSKLSLGSITLLGSKNKPRRSNIYTTESKKNLLNRKDSQDDKPEAGKTSKKVEKHDLELKTDSLPTVKTTKTKKKDDGNLKD